MDALPPRDYDRVIRPIPPPASVLLDAHRRGLSMARTVNDGFSDDILALEQAHEACSKHLEYLGNLIKSLRLRESVQQNFISSAENSIQVEEYDFSREAAGNVIDMPDIDH